jgi:hypothetical protein
MELVFGIDLLLDEGGGLRAGRSTGLARHLHRALQARRCESVPLVFAVQLVLLVC